MARLMAAALIALALATPAFAANGDQPYQNVDKRTDAGNGTGDGKVDALNRGQLDENQKPAGQGIGGSQPSQAAPAR